MSGELPIADLAPALAATRDWLARHDHRMLIGGEWVDAIDGERLQSINPATGEVLGTFPAAGAADVEHAVEAARRALHDPAWAALTPARRARLLWRMADLMEQHLDVCPRRGEADAVFRSVTLCFRVP